MTKQVQDSKGEGLAALSFAFSKTVLKKTEFTEKPISGYGVKGCYLNDDHTEINRRIKMRLLSLKALVLGLSMAVFTSPAIAQDGDKSGARKGKPDRAAILKRFDKDGDGQLSDSERAAARAARGKRGGAKGKKGKKGDIAKRLAKLFKKLDKNNDGNIDASEAAAAPERAKKFLKRADANKDGSVTRKEVQDAAKKLARRKGKGKAGKGKGKGRPGKGKGRRKAGGSDGDSDGAPAPQNP